MVSFVLRRLGSSLVLVWMIASLAFCVVAIVPGTPAPLLQARTVAPQEQHHLARALGLEESLFRRYVAWLAAAVRGDWGSSLTLGLPVSRVISRHLPASALLGLTALVVALVLSIPLALVSGRRPGSWFDLVTRAICLLLYSTPAFWLGTLALTALSFELGLFPAGHLRDSSTVAMGATRTTLDVLHHLALPSTVLALTMLPAFYRTLRSSVLETLVSPHVRTARGKGLSQARTLFAHVLSNAAGPLVQLIGLSLPASCGGVLVTEVVFSWPGMGRVAFTAMLTRDLPLVVATTTLVAIAVVSGSFVADILAGAIDPRLRDPDKDRK